MKKPKWEKIPVGLIAIIAVFLLFLAQWKAADLQSKSIYIENNLNIDGTTGQFKVFLKTDQASKVKWLRLMLNFDSSKIQIDNLLVEDKLKEAWNNNLWLTKITPYVWTKKVDWITEKDDANLGHITFVRYPLITDSAQNLAEIYKEEVIDQTILTVNYSLINFIDSEITILDLDHSDNIFLNESSDINYLTMKVFNGVNSQESYFLLDKMVDGFRIYDGIIEKLERIIKINFSVLDKYSTQVIKGANFEYSLDGIEFKLTTDTGSVLIPEEDYFYQVKADNYFDLKGVFQIDENKEILIGTGSYLNTNENEIGIVLGEYLVGSKNFKLIKKGDVTEEGLLSEEDITGTGWILFNIGKGITNRQQLLADFDENKKVTVTDLIKVLRIIQE